MPGRVTTRRGVTAPAGFLAAAVSAGLKKSGQPDLAVVASRTPAATAAIFTLNQLAAAPVQVSREHLRAGQHQRAVILNAGGANACTGAAGVRDARAMCAATARELGCRPQEVLVASTGVIGARLPMDKILAAVPGAVRGLSASSGPKAARAIMTTDTRPKLAETSVRLGGTRVTVGGMVKGSGMIHPRMATMLGVLTTDAEVRPARLQALLRQACAGTFNAISVDGQTSTNDCVFLLANGAAGPRAKVSQAVSERALLAALTDVADELARAIVADGEGAGKFLDITVTGAATDAQARIAARAVGDSSLVKTAVHGQDANWGRIASAIGATSVRLRPDRLDITINGVPLARRGQDAGTPWAQGNRALAPKIIHILVALGVGQGRARYRTCDLTAQYVAINAGYRN